MTKDFAILSVGRGVQIILSLVSVSVFASILDPSEIGKYYLIFTLISLFSQTLINPIGLFYNRHLHRWAGNKKLFNYLFLIKIYLVLLSILAVLVITLMRTYLGIAEGVQPFYLNISVMSILVFLTLNQTVIGSLNMLNCRMSFVIFSVLTQLISLILSAISVIFFNSTAFSWILGQIFALIIISFASLIHFKKIFNLKLEVFESLSLIQLPRIKNVMFFSFPLIISSLFIWLQYQSYRLIIEKYVSLEFLGFLGLGFGIAASIYASVETLIHQIYLPKYYTMINTGSHEKRTEAWNKMAFLILPLFLATTLLVSFLAPFLITVFTSSKFVDAWPYVVFGVWIEIFRSITNTLSSVAQSESRTRSVIKSYACGGIFAALSTYFLSIFDYNYFIPFALTLSGLLTVVVMYFEMKKIMSIEIGFERLLKTIFLATPLVASLIFYDLRFSFRYSFAICFFFSLYMLVTQYKNAKVLISES